MPQQSLIEILNTELPVHIPAKSSAEAVRQQVGAHINQLILHDFNQLISLLYRLDINEQKLKFLLKENTEEDAACIITDLIIERQLQKIKTRKQFRQPNNDIEKDEKW